MKQIHSFKKGFTLVELIVVIAIIAILAAVTVPAFSNYIDRARLSNDGQVAAQMTKIVEIHLINNPNDELDAFDVRTLVEEAGEEEFDFTPTAKDAGYFYIEDLNKVIVAKYEDVYESGYSELSGPKVKLLNDAQLNAATADTPEEIFAAGQFLLTTDGSVVAAVVSGLRSLGSENNLEEKYQELDDLVNDAGFFTRFTRDSRFDTRLNELLDRFDPENTLYVTDSSWNTLAESTDEVNSIVFAPGIRNVPAYNADVSSLNLTNSIIHLPKTIQSIQSGAFNDSVFSGISALAPETAEIGVASDAFLSGQQLDGATSFDLSTTLIDFSEYVKLNQNGDDIEFDLEALPIRNSITGYSSIIRGNTYRISIFTNEGLVGQAAGSLQLYHVDYMRNFPTDTFDVRLYYYESPINTFRGIPTTHTIFAGYTFDGWYLEPDFDTLIEDGATLSSTDITVYAKWIIDDES
jgi:prepilin-type N-terminal cleavage/methylation domain-containing protein/uncharacterized repeat protein (TIGR02543 family)